MTFHPIDPDAPAAPIRRGDEAEPKRRPLPSLPIETDVPIPPVATRPGYRAQQRHRQVEPLHRNTLHARRHIGGADQEAFDRLGATTHRHIERLARHDHRAFDAQEVAEQMRSKLLLSNHQPLRAGPRRPWW